MFVCKAPPSPHGFQTKEMETETELKLTRFPLVVCTVTTFSVVVCTVTTFSLVVCTG